MIHGVVKEYSNKLFKAINCLNLNAVIGKIHPCVSGSGNEFFCGEFMEEEIKAAFF